MYQWGHEGNGPEPPGPWRPSAAPGALCALEPRGPLRGRGVLGAPGAPRPLGPMLLAQGSLKPSRGPWGSRWASRADRRAGVPRGPGSCVAISLRPPEGPRTPERDGGEDGRVGGRGPLVPMGPGASWGTWATRGSPVVSRAVDSWVGLPIYCDG